MSRFRSHRLPASRPAGTSCVRLGIVALVVLASLVLSLVPGRAAGAGASAGQPIALGAEVGVGSPIPQEEQAITDFEATTGHKLAFTRDYLFWDSPFPTSLEQWLSARGTIPMISIRPQTMSGTTISWARIAAAQPGDALYGQIKAWADTIKAYGSPVYLTFDHEPETTYSAPFGSNPADFIAAWRNFHQIFDAEGVTNVKWMWIVTSWAFMVSPSDPRYGWKWYPGDAYVDDIGADAYTFYTCHGNGPRPYRSLAYQISGFLNFAAEHPTKPMWLPEFGVVENTDQPGAKAQWFTDAQALFKQPAYQGIVGISYFNINVASVNCDWRVSTSASSQTAYNALAQDPYYSGSADWTTADTSPPTVSITSPTDGTTVSGTVEVDADASDDVGVTSVEFDVDGQPVSTSTSSPYTTSVDTTTLSNGTHTLTAIATDTSNNTTTSSPVSVNVANPTTSSCAATPAGSTELSGNLSLESSQAGWTGVYSANSKVTRTSVSGGSFDGTWALQVAPKAGTTGADGVNDASPRLVPGSPGLATTVGTKYTGSAEVRASTPGQVVSILVRETTPSGTGVSSVTKKLTLNDTAWHSVSVTYTATTTGNSIRYSLFGNFTASSQAFLADCLSLQSTP